MILIEMDAAVDAAGAIQTLRVSNAPFGPTKPTDTPAMAVFFNRIVDAGSIGINTYADGKTSGGTALQIGEISIANSDGKFDAWLNYSFDGRAITIRSGPDEPGNYPTDYPIVFRGTSDGAEGTVGLLIVRLRDQQFILDKPVLTVLYAGTNALPLGVEGTPTDIKGKAKPKAYGKVLNVTPAFVNTSKLEYEVGVCNSIDAVYDRGAALTVGTTYANQAAMDAATPTASTFNTWVAGGYTRLGSSPVGEITADVTQGATSADRTVAQLLKQLALAAGISSGNISSADVTALDTANSSVIGLWLDDDSTTFAAAMDKVASSAGAWYNIDGTNTLRMGVLTAPSGTPVAKLYTYDLVHGLDRQQLKDNGLPVWRVTVNHSPVWTVQTSDLAGSVTQATRAFLGQAYRSVSVEDTAVKTQFLLAREMTVDTLLASATDAATEAARLLALYKVPRAIYSIPISTKKFAASGLKLMDVVQVFYSRFGMDSGKLLRMLGYNIELSKDTVTLTLWG